MFQLTIMALMMVQGLTPAKDFYSQQTFKYPGGVVTIRFDSTRSSSEDVERWMALSPVIGLSNGFLVPENIDLCKANDAKYEDCGSEDRRFSFRNAKLNLSAIETRIKELRDNTYPNDLMPIVRYSLAIQSFFLERGRREEAFLSTSNVEALEARFDSVDPRRDCSKEIEDVRAAMSAPDGLKTARFEWENCTWRMAQRKIGPYPDDYWHIFLKAHNIDEVVAEDSPD